MEVSEVEEVLVESVDERIVENVADGTSVEYNKFAAYCFVMKIIFLREYVALMRALSAHTLFQSYMDIDVISVGGD